MATANQPVGGGELSNEGVNEVHLICVNEYICRFHSPKSKGTETPKAPPRVYRCGLPSYFLSPIVQLLMGQRGNTTLSTGET